MIVWLSRIVRLLVGLAIFGASLAMFGMLVSGREKPQLKPEALSPMLVRGMVLHPQAVSRSWNGYGTARALQRAEVASQVSARVVERPEWLEPGVDVKAGQVLMRLDQTDFELLASNSRQTIESWAAQAEALEAEQEALTRQIELAHEEVEIAKRDLARVQDAIERGAGTVSEIDARMAAVRRAERVLVALEQQMQVMPARLRDIAARIEAQRASLRQAEENIDRCTIRAPFDGTVQEVSLRAGEWASVGRSLVQVVNLRTVEVPVRLPIEASGSVQVGDESELRLRIESSQVWRGRVARVSPESDEQTRSLTVYVEAEQQEQDLLRPGQFVVASITEGRSASTVLVPRRTIEAGRVYIATQSESREAAIWPLASRLALSLARRVAESSDFERALQEDLEATLTAAASIEVGDRGNEVAAAAAGLTRTWLDERGSDVMGRQLVEGLERGLTPTIAQWLMAVDPDELPDALRQELQAVDRLFTARSVAVDALFSVEGAFPSLDGVETQWVAVRARDGSSLDGMTLLSSNLDQIQEGSLIDVVIDNAKEGS